MTFINSLKRAIRAIPGVSPLYDRVIYPRLLARDKKPYRLAEWAALGQKLAREYHTLPITITPDDIWVTDASGCQWNYDPSVQGGIHSLEFGNPFEQELMDLFLARCTPNGVFVDVGANIGYFSVRLCSGIPGLRAYSFEPVQSTFRRLEKNVQRNGLGESVCIHRAALADHEGSIQITSGLGTGNHLLSGIAEREASEETPLWTLDSWAERVQPERIDLIKCDIEGAELFFLQGARKTLERYHPLLALEIYEPWTRRAGYAPAEIFSLLSSLGYRAERILPQGLQPASGNVAEDLAATHNFFFSYGA